MKSFVIGRVLEPEERTVRTKDGDRKCFSLAILSGRFATQFDVWDDSKIYDKLKGFYDGDEVCAVVGDGLDNRGKIKYYLNDIASCPSELRDEFRALFQ